MILLSSDWLCERATMKGREPMADPSVRAPPFIPHTAPLRDAYIRIRPSTVWRTYSAVRLNEIN